jgi:NAD(P)-dependent dehydrogenase (short-subunit alcohol dehydrogenase family)
LIPHGIRVNSLTPTATDPAESLERNARWGRKGPSSEQVKSLQQLLQPFRDRVAMQKLPSPRDYGLAAAFLASDDAAMITGTDLRVDAGAIAQYWAWDPSSKRS